MSKKRRSQSRHQTHQTHQTHQKPPTPTHPTLPPPTPSLRERLEERVALTRPPSALITLRAVFFGLLTYDLWWIQLSHAPRYGAGGFNVPHLPLLSALTPTPDLIGALYLTSGALSLLAAVGVGGRAVVALLATLYGAAYLWSQADSYQHHYLLVLLLTLLAWSPLSPSRGARPHAPPPAAHPSYNALIAQLALIYFWTGVAKIEPAWLSGDTLSNIITDPEKRATVTGWGGALGLTEAQTFMCAAWAVMSGEIAAALAFMLKGARPFAFFVVPWFHISVEWVGFDIELFSYYMLALNLTLLSPATLWRPLDAALTALTRASERLWARPTLSRPLLTAAWVASGIAVGHTISETPAEGSGAAGILAGLLTAGAGALSGATLPRALAVALTAALSLSALRASDFGFDYYRMWGGDLKRRGDLEGAARAYERANSLKARGPARHAALGETYSALGRYAEAAAAYEEEVFRRRDEALGGRPGDARARAQSLDALTRAYQGWADALTRLGQREHAQYVREQLSADRAQLLSLPPR